MGLEWTVSRFRSEISLDRTAWHPEVFWLNLYVCGVRAGIEGSPRWSAGDEYRHGLTVLKTHTCIP